MAIVLLYWSLLAPILCLNLVPSGQVFKGYGSVGDYGDFDGDGHLDMLSYFVKPWDNKTEIYFNKFKNDSVEKDATLIYEVEGIVVDLICAHLKIDVAMDILLVMRKGVSDDDGFYLLSLSQNETQDGLVISWDSRSALQDSLDSIQVNMPQYAKYMEYTIPYPLYEYTSIHPLLCDINGDGYLDLLVQTIDKKIFVWLNFGFAMVPFLIQNVPNCKFVGSFLGYIPSPHSSAFLDMNGDCRPDLVLILDTGIETFIDIWVTNYRDDTMIYTSQAEEIKEALTLPEHYGQVSFADFNGDGTLDIAVPYCSEVGPSGSCMGSADVKISYNKQVPLCFNIWRDEEYLDCRYPTDLCTPSKMEFGLLTSINIIKWNHLFSGDRRWPITLAIGDLNNDGYADIVALVKTANEEQFVCVYENSDFIPNTTRRQFTSSAPIYVETEGESERFILQRVSIADCFEDGRNDIIIFSNLFSNTKKLHVHYYILTDENSGLFMRLFAKASVLKNEGDGTSGDMLTHGFNIRGPTFKITVIDLDGKKNPRIGTIRPQSAHAPLQVPYMVFGLGKTNNYVEELYLGMPSRNKNYSNMWISIIPNCSVVATVHQLSNPNDWTLKLSISPSKSINTLLIATITCLGVLGLFILIFDIKEKREDSEQEKGFRQNFIIN
ncbi:bifunctional FG-GAP repeat/T-cell immunomodulatory protein/Integrin alpha [Babesia duncani]|uniref:Bifunctional FG-GAP repeat/T-cell immunomodulatory protein/Integrin alpha n=1 Tax=Babesia duncani TaxID=323732 RepID=A0AAD9UNB5_9APIC|nr:bifunctional FG-GAP repeat/T-cell immunomodulatory protein/Integrin alpha [Babesia duncani]